MATATARAASSGTRRMCQTPQARLTRHTWQPMHRAFTAAPPGPFGRPGTRKPLQRARRWASGQVVVLSQADSVKPTVAITGASGLVGSRLSAKLGSLGFRVRVLTRNPTGARSKLPYAGLEFFAPAQWAAAIAGCDAVVNLAGEPIATRWTPSLKVEIKRSRLGVTRTVVAAINATPAAQRPKVFISSSAVGYYGSSPSATFSEDSGSGADYLSEVCREWEAAAAQVDPSVRLVVLRTGIVLAREGGALGRMLPIFQLFAGGPLGTGAQWVSWIHRDDLVALVVAALESTAYRGVYNATAPRPVRMSEFCSALGATLGRPSWLPVPDFALSTLLGEGASVVLEGQRVLPARAQAEGFRFQYDTIGAALASLVR